MSWKTKAFRFVALSLLAGPTTVFAVEPRLIEPSPTPPKVVFETDNAPYNVLDKFRNARSSEQIHFQAIETLFPRIPERESVRQGYTMVKELVDAKKSAIEAAARLEEERVKLEAARAELEKRAEEKWEVEPDEFDYYEFEDLVAEPEPQPDPEPRPEPQSKSVAKPVHHHHNLGTRQHKHQHSTNTATRPAAPRGLWGRLFQREGLNARTYTGWQSQLNLGNMSTDDRKVSLVGMILLPRRFAISERTNLFDAG